jgi:predicted O-methyltransferase YrrM
MKQEIKNRIKKFLDRLPYIRALKNEIETLKRDTAVAFPAGHYYSPIPSKQEVLNREKQIFGIDKKNIDGIELNEREQLELLEKIKVYYDAIPFGDNKNEKMRYYFNNEFYGYADAVFLYSMIRHYQPHKIIEIGSGFSSAVMLDTNELFFENAIQCYFIDPYPERLPALLKENDRKNHRIIRDCIQDVDLEFFKQLKENDILFVDSSHVSKTGSDVNYIVFNILPNLNSGVLIHFHDIFYPFEYPKEWVLAGRVWSEGYILRAFLEFNSKFKIILFNTFLMHFHESWLRGNMPLSLKKNDTAIWLKDCSSLWLRKL